MRERPSKCGSDDACETCGLTHDGFPCPGPCPESKGKHRWMNDDDIDGSWRTICIDCGAVAPWDEG